MTRTTLPKYPSPLLISSEHFALSPCCLVSSLLLPSSTRRGGMKDVQTDFLAQYSVLIISTPLHCPPPLHASAPKENTSAILTNLLAFVLGLHSPFFFLFPHPFWPLKKEVRLSGAVKKVQFFPPQHCWEVFSFYPHFSNKWAIQL